MRHVLQDMYTCTKPKKQETCKKIKCKPNKLDNMVPVDFLARSLANGEKAERYP